MRKLYALLKPYVWALILLLTASIIIYSCKKESSSVNETIDNAKAWYELENNGKLFALKSTKNGTLKVSQEMNWHEAGMLKLNDGRDMIHIPILIKNDSNIKVMGSFMLLIIKEKYNYSSKVIYNERSDYFTALISDEDIKQAYHNILNISEAKTLAQVKGSVVPGFNRERLMITRDEPIICTDWYWTTYDSWTGTIYDEVYLYTSCTGGGGGSAPGAGAGNTANGKEIIDSIDNSCIKEQLSLAQSAKTTIRNMLNEEFGTANFNDRDIVFYDITTLDDTVAGTTHGNSAYSFIINLNENKLPQRSKEYILSTIYHEILHAYMDTQIGKDASGNYLLSNQHQTMADKYVFLMTGALKIAFPSISDKDAWALSWGGLEDTPFYTTKLSTNERSEIQNLMDMHRKSKAANLRHGTYCN